MTGLKFIQHFTYDGREADLEVESKGYGGVTMRVKFLQEVVDTEVRGYGSVSLDGDDREEVEVVTGRRKEGKMIEFEWDKERLRAFITALEVFAL